ncbi:hypothetical protein [Sphingomicrobium flavum]|uniref:hypothetical protein n=1 Tax=Sphingomicrobium flavum TaxID=1229164 RepID=UPI0021ADDE10|nr:hypothetical protein [Sphingomicrobium flavum]
MRIFIPAIAICSLAACASEEPVEPIENAEVTEPATRDDMSPAGMTFEVEGEPGVDRTAFGTDGTFTDYFEGELHRTGTYEMRDDGTLCFTYMGGDNVMPEEVTECWTMDGPPDEEGWANSTRISDGLTIRARPIQK